MPWHISNDMAAATNVRIILFFLLSRGCCTISHKSAACDTEKHPITAGLRFR
jgi:hypothetical protein